MKTAVLIIVVLAICATQAYPGMLSENLDLSLSVRGKTMTGHTTYTINFSEMHLFQGHSVVANYTSELEFPLDVFVTEYTLSLGGKPIKNLPWSLNVSYATNANDPGNPMKDSDWLQVPLANFDEMISFTESDAVLEADYLDIYGRAAVWNGNRIRIDVLLGYEYQKMSFNVTGVDGWQLDSLMNREYFSGFDGEVVGTYEVKYQMPYAGVAAAIDIISHLGLDATVKASPLVSSSDVDDHVLRYKLSESDATGAMISADGCLNYILFGPGHGLSWVIGLGYEYTYIDVTGTQTQTWYGDDPATTADDTGTEITGIRNKSKSSQHGLSVTFTARF